MERRTSKRLGVVMERSESINCDDTIGGVRVWIVTAWWRERNCKFTWRDEGEKLQKN